MENNSSFLIFALIFLTLASAFFSSSEIALFSLSTLQVKGYKNEKDKRKQLIRKLLNEPRDLLVTVFILNILINILLQNVVSDMFGQYANWSLKVGVPLFITLVFGEVLPKNIGIQYNEFLSYYFAPIVFSLQKFITPIRKFIVYITTPISRIMFFFLKKGDPISKEELKHTLETSEKHGVLTSEEYEYVRGYLNFQEVTVREVMRPRSEILFYEIKKPISKLIHLFKDKECSRVPVCDENLNDIKGIIYVRDFFTHKNIVKEGSSLFPFLTEPTYVTELMSAKLLLKKFLESNEKLAIVVDEYGEIVGLITFEDLAELIIGEIEDLRDSKKLYRKTGENEIITDGRLELSEFYSIFKFELENPNNLVTIGGWVIEKLREIPKSGRQFETDRFFFHILSADPNKIKQLYIRFKPLKE